MVRRGSKELVKKFNQLATDVQGVSTPSQKSQFKLLHRHPVRVATHFGWPTGLNSYPHFGPELAGVIILIFTPFGAQDARFLYLADFVTNRVLHKS